MAVDENGNPRQFDPQNNFMDAEQLAQADNLLDALGYRQNEIQNKQIQKDFQEDYAGGLKDAGLEPEEIQHLLGADYQQTRALRRKATANFARELKATAGKRNPKTGGQGQAPGPAAPHRPAMEPGREGGPLQAAEVSGEKIAEMRKEAGINSDKFMGDVLDALLPDDMFKM